MSHVFTNYPESSDIVLESGKDFKTQKDKEIEKLKKKVKKLKKTICKMKKRLMDESEFVSENGKEEKKQEKKQEKKFRTKMGDAFLQALPTIFRTMFKVVVTTLCGCIAKSFGKAQMA